MSPLALWKGMPTLYKHTVHVLLLGSTVKRRHLMEKTLFSQTQFITPVTADSTQTWTAQPTSFVFSHKGISKYAFKLLPLNFRTGASWKRNQAAFNSVQAIKQKISCWCKLTSQGLNNFLYMHLLFSYLQIWFLKCKWQLWGAIFAQKHIILWIYPLPTSLCFQKTNHFAIHNQSSMAILFFSSASELHLLADVVG